MLSTDGFFQYGGVNIQYRVDLIWDTFNLVESIFNMEQRYGDTFNLAESKFKMATLSIFLRFIKQSFLLKDKFGTDTFTVLRECARMRAGKLLGHLNWASLSTAILTNP